MSNHSANPNSPTLARLLGSFTLSWQARTLRAGNDPQPMQSGKVIEFSPTFLCHLEARLSKLLLLRTLEALHAADVAARDASAALTRAEALSWSASDPAARQVSVAAAKAQLLLRQADVVKAKAALVDVLHGCYPTPIPPGSAGRVSDNVSEMRLAECPLAEASFT